MAIQLSFYAQQLGVVSDLVLPRSKKPAQEILGRALK
jgi:hypothetical protein